MTVTEALKILQRAPKDQPRFSAVLACGFTPLHLQLILTAHLQNRLASRTVDVKTGLYGNLAVTLETLDANALDAIACAIEWPDLDPRFSYREAGGWGLRSVIEMVDGALENLNRLSAAFARIPDGVRIAVSLPTLPAPPIFHTVGSQSSNAELHLEQSLSNFAVRLAARRGTVVVNARLLNELSPCATRLDLKSDFATGFPYTLTHADALAGTFAGLMVPAAPKKGIITDLDDTLWRGIAGEVGAEGVAWDLSGHSQPHALYQKLLSSLAEAGTLVAVASKNDRAVVDAALERHDILLPSSQIFPIEAHWEAKSGSVERILRAWNISADAVIFVDDSPMELAEVAASHPGITCMQFPTREPHSLLAFLRSLRNLCGKEYVTDDDALRLASIRQNTGFQEQATAAATADDFLRSADAALTIEFDAITDTRALELVNKTNQFNINGARLNEAEWKKRLSCASAFTMVVSYRDKFGPLGKIAVLQGVKHGDVARIETWVMSCRAFARRIEYQCLRLLFERAQVSRLEIDFSPTPKNKPVHEFLTALCGEPSDGPYLLTRAQLQEKCPPLFHHITLVDDSSAEVMSEVEVNG